MRTGRTLALALVLWSLALEPAAAGWRAAPIVPVIGPRMERHLRAELRDARAHGNRARVFAKAGDSISYASSYLSGVGCSDQALPPRFRFLEPTIAFFDQGRLGPSLARYACGPTNPFTRASAATAPYRTAAWATSPGLALDPLCAPEETPLQCETRITRPAFALVMFGTTTRPGVSQGPPTGPEWPRS